MGSLNKVLIIGRVGQDPEKRITTSGHSVVNISVATTDYFKDKSGNKQERTEWNKIQLWDKLAEITEKYVRKGSQIYIEGSLQTRDWQDKDGNKRYSTEIVAKQMQFLDSKKEVGGQQQSHQAQGYSQEPMHNTPPPKNDDFLEEDIPF